jgi:hypothetical protein
LHGDECEDGGVDPVTVARGLEVGVVLLAGGAGVGVEFRTVDVVEAGEVEEWWVPSIAVYAGVKPVFGSCGC